jgi:hypothetical protein
MLPISALLPHSHRASHAGARQANLPSNTMTVDYSDFSFASILFSNIMISQHLHRIYYSPPEAPHRQNGSTPKR